MDRDEESAYPRRALELLRKRSADEPVIALHGPRSVGKSTLLHEFASHHRVDVLDLDESTLRDAAERNLSAFIGGPLPLCIDEYQRLPVILDEIKSLLNRNGSLAGTAVLTGSTRHDALPRNAQALTGRLHVMTLLPLSQGEIERTREDFLEQLIRDPASTIAAKPSSNTSRDSYIERICLGGFPIALSRTGTSRNRWFDDYVRLSIERDASELSRIRQRGTLYKVLMELAARTAQVLSIASITNDVGIARNTAEHHIRLLEDLFLVRRIDAWGTNLRSRVLKHPKIHLIDSGLAARLLRVSAVQLTRLDVQALTDLGHLVETFVVGELSKQASWLDQAVTLGHWRTAEGDEVDVVVELEDGRVLAFEVKSGSRVTSPDLRGLRKLRDAVGERFVAGVVLTTGTRSFTFEDRLHICPLDRLWTAVDRIG